MIKYWKYWFLLIANFLSKGINLFNYPVYTEDEGTYVSQAMAILEHGELAYYTYWYDHAPLGWYLISAWQFVLRVLHINVGHFVNEGRLLMVVVSTVTLFLFIKTLEVAKVSSINQFLISLLYIFSPLAIYYHRSVFLDNIMIMWVFVSLYFLFKADKLHYAALSGLSAGVAILSKETAVFFLPFLFAYLFYKKNEDNKTYAIPIWCFFVGVVILQYFVMAFLKGELFPSQSFLGNPDQVSLLDTLLFQNNRKEQFWSETSMLRTSLSNSWLKLDPVMVILGVWCVMSNFFNSFKKKNLYLGFLFAVGYIFYLLKWKALEWYIIPLIPVLLIAIALWLERNGKIFGKYWSGTVCLLLLFLNFLFFYKNIDLFTVHATQSQNLLISWAKQHITKSDFVVIDNYAFLELNNRSGRVEDFQYHYFWKVERDPDIRKEMLYESSSNIDYLFLTEAMADAFVKYDFPFLESFIDKAYIAEEVGDVYPIKIYKRLQDQTTS